VHFYGSSSIGCFYHASRKIALCSVDITYTFRNGAVCFVYTVPGYEYTSFAITETSTVSAVRDFMSWLPESGVVHSTDETLCYLKSKLADEFTEK
jgi:hypothetical protein